MNAIEFFEDLNAKNWRNNIENETTHKLKETLEILTSEKDALVEEVINNLQNIKEIKLEDKEEFEYGAFQKWMKHYINEAIANKLEEIR